MNDTVNQYADRYRAWGLDGGPATGAEVRELERAAGVRLPDSYKAYLLIAGRRPPGAWVGSDCALGQLAPLRAGADALLRENGRPPLPAGAFVFLMHQGYQFFYFATDDDAAAPDDPPVWYYLEAEPAAVRSFERFSEMVAAVAAESARG
ncbi:MAG TPA: SMI1/KNR4 family protein [Tepidisphaeraceae bacterium]|nr:SMI1/KNR4 family protein [Tepidisphaeraceae bacterium]